MLQRAYELNRQAFDLGRRESLRQLRSEYLAGEIEVEEFEARLDDVPEDELLPPVEKRQTTVADVLKSAYDVPGGVYWYYPPRGQLRRS
jgi:hypothetical protein